MVLSERIPHHSKPARRPVFMSKTVLHIYQNNNKCLGEGGRTRAHLWCEKPVSPTSDVKQ